MKNKYTKMDGIQPSRQNPFLAEAAGNAKLTYRSRGAAKAREGFLAKSFQLLDRSTGEITEDELIIGIREQVDKTKFVKFYIDGLVRAFELSKGARELLLIFLQHYGEETAKTPNARNDHLIFSFELAKEVGYEKSRQTFRSSLNELCLKKFMHPSALARDAYFINPGCFYNGKRLRLIQEFVLKDDVDITPPTGGDPDLDQLGFDGLTERERRG